MTKVLVREHNASEELDQLREFLNTEAQRIVQLDEENPAPKGLAEDDDDQITWYIHKGGEVPAGLFSVVISDDGSGAENADIIVLKDEFSPSKLLDDIRSRFDEPTVPALLQLEGGYVTGDASHLEYVEGVAPTGAADEANVLEVWRMRLRIPNDDKSLEDESSDDDRPAVPTITMRAGW